MTCDRSVVISTNKTDRHDITEIVESGVKHHQTNKYTLYNIIIQIRPSLIPTFRPGRFSILKNSLKSNKLFVCGDGTCKLSELPDSSGEMDSFVSRLPFLSFTSATSDIEKMQFYLVSLYTSY